MSKTIKKSDFVKAFLSRGLGYSQANSAYDAFLGVMEQAVLEGNKIRLGHIGTVIPVESDPRTVKMGFKREGGKVVPCQREFALGRRIQFKFKLHTAFMNRHEFKWFTTQ